MKPLSITGPELERRLDALLNAGKEEFNTFYAANATRGEAPGFVWVVLNHGDQLAAEASFVDTVHATLPLALSRARALMENEDHPLTAQPYPDDPNVIDVLAGDYWVQITRQEVVRSLDKKL